MKRNWSGVFVAVGLAATAVLGAQGNPSPANTPAACRIRVNILNWSMPPAISTPPKPTFVE